MNIKLCKQWELMSEIEEKKIWDKIYKYFDFKPDYYAKEDVYNIKLNYDLYDCTAAAYIADTDIEWSENIRKIFLSTLVQERVIIALEWQGLSFWYNPYMRFESKDPLSKDNFSLKKENSLLDTPRFYPDGEYYIFLAKDFSFGYLTDPWRKKIYVYGNLLRKNFRDQKDSLKLKLLLSE